MVAAPVAAPPAAAAPSSDDPTAVWQKVLEAARKKSVVFGALLDHGDVVSLTGGTVTLSFAEKMDVERAEKARADIEATVSAVLGKPTKVTISSAAASGAAVRSAVGAESDAASADRKVREVEARQHPVIRRAQDLFGATLKEIKT